ncbi:MAG: prepilin peptidase [Bacteroides sp.]|nr:prepilin peptidase [Bacteroides sp.]
MTTGIPTVNDTVCLLYELAVLCCVAGFAAYDLKKKRVPDRALVFFCPLFFAAPLFRCGFLFPAQALLPELALSFAGMAAGFFVLLAAALISHDGAGIGGGDIKLAALMGFAYGPYRLLAILLTAAFLAGCFAFVLQFRKRALPLCLPFVPFLATGSLIMTAATLFR